jgi:acetoacetyl-CoA reductase
MTSPLPKLALVTGGTRGIGAAISTALKAAGYDVAANYATNHKAAHAFEKQTGVAVFPWDVCSFAETEAGVAKIEEKFGRPVDILVNNAGITRDGAFHKMTEKDWDAVLDTNLRSCFNLCRVIFPKMRDKGFGRIVNVSSVNGQAGQFGQVNYAAAKAGMLGFTRALALEGAKKNVTVNAVAPGYINTEMVGAIDPAVLKGIVDKIPVGRLGEVNEIARTILFLIADEAGFITGATFNINGGQHRI